MLSSPSWEFLKLINPRHDSSPSERGTLFHSERGVSDNTLKRHGHLAVKTFFPPLVLWPIVSEEREVSFKSFHKLIINSSLYSFYCHLFRTHTPAFTVTNPPSLPKTYQITSVIFKILIGTITRGNTVADMGNHGRKANVNLLLGLERFARAHWETPKTKKNFENHTVTDSESQQENKNRCGRWEWNFVRKRGETEVICGANFWQQTTFCWVQVQCGGSFIKIVIVTFVITVARCQILKKVFVAI